MDRISTYIILEDVDQFTLVNKVKAFIGCDKTGVEGVAFSELPYGEYWQPQGGVTYSDKKSRYFQAMVGGK